MKKVVAFHLYNDYSGSPKVLKDVLEGMIESGCHIDLFTSDGGVLDELHDSEYFKKSSVSYLFSEHNKALTIFRLFRANLIYFFNSLKYKNEDAIFYINTIMPFGAALGAKLIRKKVVYHYHENAYAKNFIYKSLANIMQWLANEIICVSKSQASYLKKTEKVTVVPNAVSRDFVNDLCPDIESAFERKTVLMLSSLKEYKGTIQFIDIATKLPQYNFLLVINDDKQNIDTFINTRNYILPPNIVVYARQKNVAKFYNNASIVLNLSDKRLIVETFGLTALEAMHAGLPLIVPTVGGISELVQEGVNGYHIDVENLDDIIKQIDIVLSDKKLYLSLATESLSLAENYKYPVMVRNIINICEK